MPMTEAEIKYLEEYAPQPEGEDLKRLTRIAYERYPVAGTLTIMGADKVEFKHGKVWLHHIAMNIRPPYPSPWRKTIKYIIDCIKELEVVPYENRSDCEQYVDIGRGVVDKMITRLTQAAEEDDIGFFHEVFTDGDTGITFDMKINILF